MPELGNSKINLSVSALLGIDDKVDHAADGEHYRGQTVRERQYWFRAVPKSPTY